MKKIKIRINGITPLILNRFTEAAQRSATSGTKASFVGDRGTPQEIAESKLYKDNDDNLVVPGPNLFRSFIDAGTYFKSGKSKLSTQKSSLIPACCMLLEPTINIKHKQRWQVDTRPVRIPSTGGRILAHRPLFDDWELTFTIELDESIISEKLFRDVVDTAGSRIGLGDFRPACKGLYGRYKVTLWQVKDTND